jgi:TP901 family phage tail tape measure protein
MSDQQAKIEITASSSKLASGLRAAAGRFNSWAAGMKAGAKKIGGGAAGSFLGTVGANLAGKGIDFIADQGREVLAFEEKLTRLQINAGKSSAEMDTFRQKARQLSSAVGLSANDILEGTTSYVDLTGDVNGAGAAMETFARVAQASGSSVADIATAAAAMKQSFGLKPEEIEATFSGMISQGKAGAITLKDFAAEMSSLAPKWSKFNESTTTEGIAQFGAALQVARQGFGNASEAATGMEALMGGIIMHAKDLRKYGHVEVFDKHKDGSKTLKTFEQIMAAIEQSKLVKDPELMGKALGGRKEAQDTLNVLLRARQNLTDTGNEYTDLVAKGKDAEAVQRDLATYLDSSSGKMATSWESLKNSIAEALTPERIQSFATSLKEVADHAGEIASALGKVFGFIGTLNSVGKKIRGVFGNDGDKTYSERDIILAQTHGAGLPGQERNMSAEAREARYQGALGRMADVEQYNKAKGSIMGGEVAERVSEESVKRALAASAGTAEWGKGRGGEMMAGEQYLRAAQKENPEIVAKVQGEMLSAAIKDGFTDVVKNLGVTLKIGDNTVAKANVKATDPRRKL